MRAGWLTGLDNRNQRCENGRIATLAVSRRSRRRGARVLTRGLAFILIVALVGVWARVIQTMTAPPKPKASFGHVQAVVWDGRVFQTPAQLHAFFQARGISYSRWAAAHPGAFDFDKVQPRQKVIQTGRGAPAERPPSTRLRTDDHVAVSSAGPSQARSMTRTLVVLFMLLSSMAILVSALIPVRLAPEFVRRVYVQPDRRVAALAIGVSVLIGLLVSSYLS